MTFELDGTRYEICTLEHDRWSFCSLHGLLRTMQRLNVTEKKALHIINDALHKGQTVAELPMRWQREYVENVRILAYNGWTKLRVLRNCLFIFSCEGRLITVYNLPKSFNKRYRFDSDKQPVRNLRKYLRMNPAVS